jgi:hypothetical protein
LRSNGLAVLSVGLMNYGHTENGIIWARFSTVLKQKTSLLHDIESIDFLLSHAKSFMGCIKIICDDLGAMA